MKGEPCRFHSFPVDCAGVSERKAIRLTGEAKSKFLGKQASKQRNVRESLRTDRCFSPASWKAALVLRLKLHVPRSIVSSIFREITQLRATARRRYTRNAIRRGEPVAEGYGNGNGKKEKKRKRHLKRERNLGQRKLHKCRGKLEGRSREGHVKKRKGRKKGREECKKQKERNIVKKEWEREREKSLEKIKM